MKQILNIFKEFNDNNIEYFILRDFETIDNILNSRDIDIYVNPLYRKNVSIIMNKLGWYTPRTNDNKYPHKQFYKMISGKVFKFDLVYGLNYGKRNYSIKENLVDVKKFNRIENIKIAEEKNALITMLLHMLFDKENISEKNLKIFKNIFKNYEKKYNNRKDDFYIISKKIIENNINDTNKNITEYQKMLYKYIKENKFKNIFIKSKILLCKIVKNLYLIFSRRNIAIIGVDGSGKSSIINELNSIFSDNSVIVYMGQKDYETKLLKKLVNKEKCNIIHKIIKRILMIYEQFKRYYKYRFTKKIVFFDRYVDDSFINSRKSEKIFNNLLYKVVFPKPKLKIYMYCNTEISFRRKTDIIDKDAFKNMKKRYDDYYLNNNKVISICTDNTKENDVIELLSEKINEKIPNILL